MRDFWNTVLNFAERTTAEVGQQLMRDFGAVQAEEKADGSLVTRADHWADATIREAIATTFPQHGILSEEGEHIFPTQDWCWIIDPLDGTTNFTRGIPIWGICLALLYQGTPVFGFVHLPPLNQSFHGFWLSSSGLEGTNGAFLNHKPIHPTPDAPSSQHFFNLCSRSVSLAPKIPCKIRMLGMAAYNFLTVAAGATVGGVEATPKIWDISAPNVIVQAAGAVWVPLSSAPIFPLTVGEDYGQKSYPTLIVNQPENIALFESLVKPLS